MTSIVTLTNPATSANGLRRAQNDPGVERALVCVEVKRHAEEQVAQGDAEYERRHESGDEDAPVPGAAPARVVHLAAIVETHRAEEEREQHEDQRDVEPGECRRVDERPGGERRAAGGDEPHLVSLPRRSDGVEHHAALVVGAADVRQQHARAEVPSVENREADEQDADDAHQITLSVA
jgi:hypothetical protein